MTSLATDRPAHPAPILHIATFFVLAVLLTGTVDDPDLWGHVKFGRDIVQLRMVPRSDQYSFTADKPWIDHEWLAEVLMYVAYAAGGSTGLVLLKTTLAAGLLLVALLELRRFRPAWFSYDASLMALTLGVLWRIQTVRPQLFSLLLFAALLTVLTAAERGRSRMLLFIPLIMALWVNLHGGWIVGLGVLFVWGTFTSLRAPTTGRTAILATCAAGLVATLLNPYGTGIWTFVSETVRFNRPDIPEWSSIPQVGLGPAIPWLISLSWAAVVLFKAGLPARFGQSAAVLALAFASFRTNRLDAFFAIAVAILLAPQIAAAFPNRKAPGRAARRSLGTLFVAIAMSIVLTFLTAGALKRNVECLELISGLLPEPEAVQFFQDNHLQGRVLVWFDWGEYAIWHLSPAIRVSLDGRRETVYSDAVLSGHTRFFNGLPGGVEFLDQLRPDFVWIPSSLPTMQTLTDRQWAPLFRGPVSTIFAKVGSSGLQATAAVRSPRCFPGP